MNYYTEKLTTAIIDKIIEERAAPYLEDGKKVNITKLPNDPNKRWEWFVKVRAHMNYLIFIKNFQQQFPTPHAEIIRTKLVKMQEFIDEALKKAGEGNWLGYKLPRTNPEFRRTICVRVITEYYKDHPNIGEYGYADDHATSEAEIYGEYVLFKEWLEKHPCLDNSKDDANKDYWRITELFQFEKTNKYLYNDTDEIAVILNFNNVKPGDGVVNAKYTIQNKYAIPLPYYIGVSHKDNKKPYWSENEFQNVLSEIDHTIRKHYRDGHNNGVDFINVEAFFNYHFEYAKDKNRFIEYCNRILKKSLGGDILETLNSWLEETSRHKGQIGAKEKIVVSEVKKRFRDSDPLATLYMNDEEYTFYCMHWEKREELKEEEETFFKGYEKILSTEYRDFAERTIRVLINGQDIVDTPDNRMIKAYHQHMQSSSGEFFDIKDDSTRKTLEKLIVFNSSETINKLFSEIKGYFPEKENELQKALNGEQLTGPLLFPHNQNKFVEVFKRLKYNGYLLSTPTEIKNWICSNFTYRFTKGAKKEERQFNISTVHDILTKDKREPAKKERICTPDWLPYKSHLQQQREAEKEKF